MRQLIITAALLVTASLVPASAHAADYYLYTSGMCTRNWTGGKGDGYIRDVKGFLTEVEVLIDQRYDHDAATREFASKYLDVYCTGSNTCRINAYSNGAAVASKALSVYGNGQWNIAWVMTNGGNHGGSELASTGWVAEIFGGCDLADEITPSRHRAWNHHNMPSTWYELAGTDELGAWYDPRRATSAFLPGEDDGAVAMHSGGGFSSTGSRDSACESGRWTRHQAVYWCSFDRDHYQLKMHGARCYAEGGCDYD
jgi:hypothetical protein